MSKRKHVSKKTKGVKPAANPVVGSLVSILEEKGWQIITFEKN